MKFEKDEIITLDNNEEYMIVDRINYMNNTYLYLAKMDEDKFSVVKLIANGDQFGLGSLEENEYLTVLDLLRKNNK